MNEMFLYSTVSTLNPTGRQGVAMGSLGPQLTDCWDGGDDLTELELVKDGGLTSGIETDLRRR